MNKKEVSEIEGNMNIVVDAESAGLTVCPICKNHSVNETGWCNNGCNASGRKRKTKIFIIKIDWCPDNLDAEDIRLILEDELGIFAQVKED